MKTIIIMIISIIGFFMLIVGIILIGNGYGQKEEQLYYQHNKVISCIEEYGLGYIHYFITYKTYNNIVIKKYLKFNTCEGILK